MGRTSNTLRNKRGAANKTRRVASSQYRDSTSATRKSDRTQYVDHSQHDALQYNDRQTDRDQYEAEHGQRALTSNPGRAPEPIDGWSEHRVWVTKTLEGLQDSQCKIFDKVTDLAIRFEGLSTAFKIKAGIWGAIGSVIPGTGAVLAYLYFRG